MRSLIFFALALAGCGAETLKIGALYDLSGDGSSLDLPAANGVRLAVDELNRAGGLLGRTVELTVIDTQYKLDKTQAAAQRLVEDGVTAVVGFSDNDSVLWAGPIIQAGGIPLVTSGATSPLLPAQIGDGIFLACFGDNVQAAAAAEYAQQTFGRRAALLYDDGTDYTRGLAGYFRTRFLAQGGAVALDASFADRAASYDATASAVQAVSPPPDFLFVAAMPYNVGQMIKALRDGGYQGPIVGGDSYDTPDLLATAGPAANGVTFTTHALVDAVSGSAAMKQFITAYQKAYGSAPADAFAALGYDALRLVAAAIARAASDDPERLKTALEATQDFVALTGTISFSAASHVPKKTVTLIAIEGGRRRLISEWVPSEVPAP